MGSWFIDFVVVYYYMYIFYILYDPDLVHSDVHVRKM